MIVLYILKDNFITIVPSVQLNTHRRNWDCLREGGTITCERSECVAYTAHRGIGPEEGVFPFLGTGQSVFITICTHFKTHFGDFIFKINASQVAPRYRPGVHVSQSSY